MNAWELVLKAMAVGYQVEVEQDGMVAGSGGARQRKQSRSRRRSR